MSKKLKSFDDYISIFPENLKQNIKMIGSYSGNRTNVSYKFLCGCETEKQIKSLIRMTSFEFCPLCKIKNKQIVSCKYCKKEFTEERHLKYCEQKCYEEFKDIEVNKDYVICSICGYHGKSLANHVFTVHHIDPKEYKKNNQIICSDSKEKYVKSAQENSKWLSKAIAEGKDLTEYWKKVSDGVRASILNNPEERARRSQIMTKVNQSDIMRKKASDTAKITSSREDILQQRSERLKNWRINNRSDFYNKCTRKMINTYNSKPERLLFTYLLNNKDYSFKRNQTLKSKLINNFSNKKQIDIADKNKKIYVEFDGILHFIPKFGEQKLSIIKNRDEILEKIILNRNNILIRVSYDQFVHRTIQVNKVKQDVSYFKQECLDQIEKILKEYKPGIYKIGEAYKK